MILFDIRDLYGPPPNEREASDAFQARLAVSAVFDQIEPLQAQLARIASYDVPIERLGELANVFEALSKFEVQVGDLAKVLESMHDFQHRLRPAPRQFAPLEGLDQQLKSLCGSFAEHLSGLADALAPAVTLQGLLAHLAGEFTSAKVLRENLLGLAHTFASRSPTMTNGRNRASSPSNRRR
jgi:hypothetical protein